MADDKKPAPTGETDSSDNDSGELDARIAKALAAQLNPAISSHMKRATASFERLLAEQIGKITTPEKPADKPPEGSASKADPEVLKLREQVEKLTRQSEDDRKARQATEERSRRDSARASIREALEAKGSKGARARTVIADLEQSGALRFTEEGSPG